jgi:hypothetical protein
LWHEIRAICFPGFVWPLSGSTISVAVKLPYVSEVGPGPDFPALDRHRAGDLATFLIFVLLAILEHGQGSIVFLELCRQSFAGWAAMMLAIALLGKIGFGLSFILLTIFLLVALDRRPPLLAVAVGVGLAVVFHLIFVVALDVALPTGFWGF